MCNIFVFNAKCDCPIPVSLRNDDISIKHKETAYLTFIIVQTLLRIYRNAVTAFFVSSLTSVIRSSMSSTPRVRKSFNACLVSCSAICVSLFNICTWSNLHGEIVINLQKNKNIDLQRPETVLDFSQNITLLYNTDKEKSSIRKSSKSCCSVSNIFVKNNNHINLGNSRILSEVSSSNSCSRTNVLMCSLRAGAASSCCSDGFSRTFCASCFIFSKEISMSPILAATSCTCEIQQTYVPPSTSHA